MGWLLMPLAGVGAAALVWLPGAAGALANPLAPPPDRAGDATTHSASAAGAVAGIPTDYLGWYRRHGDTCPGLDWALLAGVGKVETDHGRVRLPGVHSGENYAGAGGPMQFLAPTWREVRGRHPEIGGDRYDPDRAIAGAAHYLCDSGLNKGEVRKALWAYNHSRPYADKVLDHAARYRAAAGE